MTTIAEHLELSQDGELSRRISASWPSWQECDPRLRRVAAFEDFRDWLQTSESRVANETLHALAWLGAEDGGHDPVAASALAWALLPGANRLARELRDTTPDIDALVSGQLWLEIKVFPWRRLTKVASNILLNTRSAVLSDLGLYPLGRRRRDRVWAATSVWDPSVLYDEKPVHARGTSWRPSADETGIPVAVGLPGCRPVTDESARPSPGREVVELLGWAHEAGVIAEADRLLLLCLLEEAIRNPPPRRSDVWAGLTSPALGARASARSGFSARQVERRIPHVIGALVAAVPRYISEYGGSTSTGEAGGHTGVAVAVDTWVWPGRKTTGTASSVSASSPAA